MIKSIQNVHSNFFSIFKGGDNVVNKTFTDYNGQTFSTRFHYAKKSGEDKVEQVRENYPVITIDDFTPFPRKGYYFPDTKIIGALRPDPNDTSPNPKDAIASILSEPICLVCKYQINVATKRLREMLAIKDWLLLFQYESQPAFVFNKVTNQPTLGDYVEYQMSFINDLDRSDGIMEAVYEIELYPYVHIIEPQDVTLITNFALNMHNQS